MPLKPETALRKDRNQPSGRDVMQHRHYAEIARIIRDMEPSLREPTMQHFADMLGATNSRFDYRRFVAACQP